MLRNEREIKRRRLLEQQRLTQVSLDGFCVVSTRDGRILDVNEAYCHMVGYSRNELLRMRIADLEANESPAEVAAHIKKVMVHGHGRFETRQRHKLGHLVDLEISVSHSASDSGVNHSFIRDITARKRTEDALLFIAQRSWVDSSENFFNALAQYLGVSLGVDYVIIDRLAREPGIAETVALYAKGAIVPNIRYALKGTPCDNVIGQQFCFYPQGIQQMFPEDVLLVEMGAESYAGIPLWDAAGQPIGLIAVMHGKPFFDETAISRLLQIVALRAAAELERERSDRMLREREQAFRILAESMPDNLMRFDRQCRVQYMNPAMRTSLAPHVLPELGKRLTETFPGNSVVLAFERQIERVMATGEVGELEFQMPNLQGESRTHHLRYVAERDDSGAITGVLAIGRDITERKRVEQYEQFRSRMLELLSGETPLQQVLEGIVLGVEQLNPEMICSILLLDSQGNCLGESVAPSLPDFYNEAVNGLEIGPTIGSCGAAAFTGERVVVEDIKTHPNWAPFVELATRAGLGACWSQPVRTASGQVLGTFAVYHRQAHTPAESDIAIIEKTARLVSIAIERKQAEEALHASEERMRLFFERQLVGTAITSPEKGWLQVNDRICEMLGYTREELAQMNWAELTYPDDLTADSAQFERLLRGEIDSYMLEKRFVRKDGGIIFTKLAVGCVRRADRSVDYVLAMLEDITERKRAEQERQAHALSLECLDRVNKAIQGTTDLDQMMSDVLDVVLSSFACDRAFMLYPCAPDADEWHVPMERSRPEYPGARDRGSAAIPMDEVYAKVMNTMLAAPGPVVFGPGTAHPLPAYLSDQFGVKSQMLMVLRPRLDKPWIFGIHQCSHAKVWTEDEAALFEKIGWRLSDALTSLLMYRNLRANEQKFRSLAENLPLTLVRYDREGRRTYLNPYAERHFGVAAAQMIGKTLREANPINLPQREAYQRALSNALATGERSEFEMRVPSASDEVRIDHVFIAAERAADGEITGAIAIGRDITALKQAERQLRELTAHLQTVREEEQARLAREIHDDLGSTLAALKLRVSLLLEFELPAEMKRTPLFAHLESMSSSLESAIAATRRIVSGMRPDALDNLGLFAALKWQADQFQKHTGIECRIACTENLACTNCKDCGSAMSQMQSINLFRIFQEALTNVAKHSGATWVEAEFRPGKDTVVLSVRDNGCGFARGMKISPSSYGMRGMRERVAQISGEIEFDSSPGEGLCVTVSFPLSEGKPSEQVFKWQAVRRSPQDDE